MVSCKMPGDAIYHERQRRQLCALHALNNLFQSDIYTKAQLDEVCKNLSPQVWINPHRSVLGLGDYDVNVIMTALQEKGCEAAWFDKRKDPACINFDEVVGFILNIPADYKFGYVTLPIKKRHWIAVRKIDDGQYYNLDSKLESPHCIGDEESLLTYLKGQLESNDRELFIIVQTNETENAQKWLKNTSTSSVEEATEIEAESNSKENAVLGEEVA
ncbi:josephin-like protein [Episyrphus balteatus]|uniref:josephin-like protein n=1 Tax=Episyrphus balteatus TaxID=286459 RepID=UPI002485A53D|nr:josephin-like protein [Episyrphus balteatus]